MSSSRWWARKGPIRGVHFELIDLDDTLDFGEFVQTRTFCMFGRPDIRKFCFYIFDKKDRYIEQDELTALIDLLHENDLSVNNKEAPRKFDTNGDGKIDFQEFTDMVAFPKLLHPAYRLQESMMAKTLGEKWWKSRQETSWMADKEAAKLAAKQDAESARRRSSVIWK